MVQAHQVVPFWRFTHRAGQQLQLFVLQIPRHRAWHCRIEQRDPPVADVHYGLQQGTLHRGLGHYPRLVVIAGNPARRRVELSAQLTKLLVGLERAVLGQIAGGQDQIDPRLLHAHQFDDFLQAVSGIHAQQRAVRFGEQVTVGELHQHRRIGCGQVGYARQGVLPGRDRGIG
ncbi:hypothetical protein D3C73_1164880 [compost metagenome]